MTERQLRDIFKKTKGHCHFCGDVLSFRKRGYRRQRADGCWEVDHVIQLQKGGSVAVANCLPACTPCNRLRWHRAGGEIRELLVLGIIGKSEIAKQTAIGEELVKKARGSLLVEEAHRANRKALLRFLRKKLELSFTAAELQRHTLVPKKWTKRLLETSRQADIIRRGGRYRFQGRPPKKRA